MPVLPWRRSCRDGSWRGSEGRPRPLSRRSSLTRGARPSGRALSRRMPLLALAALSVVASCAKAPPVLPAAVAGAPKYADFVYPAAAPELAPAEIRERHGVAWQFLQAGDIRAAEREFTAVLKQAPDFYPAEAGLGYTGLARKEAADAVAHFDKALARNPAYAPALTGKGEALLILGRTGAALGVFEAAIVADPSLMPLKSRIDVLKFREVQRHVE